MDYNDLEGLRTTYAEGLAAALVDFQKPPAEYHKDIMNDLRRVLTASGNPHKNTQPNQLFQADLDKDCLVDELFKRNPTVDALARLVRQVPVTTYPRLLPRSPVTMRIAARHPSWPLFRLPTIDATAAVIRTTSVAIVVTRSSRTLTPRVFGKGLSNDYRHFHN